MDLSEILSRMDRLEDLSPEELNELRGEDGKGGALREAYASLRQRIQEITDESGLAPKDLVVESQQFPAWLAACEAEHAAREQAREDFESSMAEQDAAMADASDETPPPDADSDDSDDSSDDDSSDDSDDDSESTPEGEPAAEPTADDVVEAAEEIAADAADDEELEPVTASAPIVRRMAVRVPADRQPAARTETGAPQARLEAASNLGNKPIGGEFASWHEAADSTLEVLRSFGRGHHAGPAVEHRVGTLNTQGLRPDEQRLSKGFTADENTDRLMAIREGAQAMGRGESLEALTAQGLCAPVDIRYDLVTLAETNRPLRDSHPSFDADRGGIQFNAPSTLSDVLVNQAGGAIDVVTENDQAGGPVTKTVQNVGCGALTTVEVEAISERLEFDNWGDRYNVERMEQWLQIARAAHSREAERRGLDNIEAGSTAVTVATSEIGVTRELIGSIQTAIWGLENRERASDSQAYRVVLPDFVLRMCAIDLAWQLPGDDTLAMARDEINRLLAKDGARATFTKEGATGSGMDSAAQAAGALIEFPEFVDWYIYPEGAWLFLDGGTLDFGVVRDSTLNNTNEFQTFYESFEEWAFIGTESLHVHQAVCQNGAAAAAVAADCGTGS